MGQPDRNGVLFLLYDEDSMVAMAAEAARRLRETGTPCYLWALSDEAVVRLGRYGEHSILPARHNLLPAEARQRVQAWWETARSRARRNEPVAYEGLDLKPLAVFEWAVWDADHDPRARAELLRSCAIWYERFNCAFRQLRPHVLVLWHGERAWCQVGRALAQRKGVRVACFERGPFPRSASCDFSGVNAASDVARPEAWAALRPGPLSPEQERMVDEFIARYHASAQSAWDQPELTEPAQLRKRHGIPDGAKILLFPMQVLADANLVLASPRVQTNLEAARWIVRCLPPRSAFFVVAKRHPKEPGRQARVAATLGGRGIVVEGGNIHAWLRMAHAVVTINSSTGLEALTYRKPVVLLGEALYGRKGFTSEAANEGELAAALTAIESQPRSNDEAWARFREFLFFLTERYLFWGDAEKLARSGLRLAEQLGLKDAPPAGTAAADSRDWQGLRLPRSWCEIPARILWRLRRKYRAYRG